MAAPITDYRNPRTGLSLREARFCELIKAGMNNQDAYVAAMKPDTTNKTSISTLSARLHRSERVQSRLAEICGEGATDMEAKINDVEWMRRECLLVLLDLARSPRSDGRLKLEAVRTLGQTKLVDLLTGSGAQTTVNVQQNAPGTPETIRAGLVSEIRQMIAPTPTIQSLEGATEAPMEEEEEQEEQD